MSRFICISGGLTKYIFTRSNFASRYASDRAVRPLSSSPMIATLSPFSGALAVDRVQIEQRLRRMLPAVAVAGVDHRHRRNQRRALAPRPPGDGGSR